MEKLPELIRYLGDLSVPALALMACLASFALAAFAIYAVLHAVKRDRPQ